MVQITFDLENDPQLNDPKSDPKNDLNWTNIIVTFSYLPASQIRQVFSPPGLTCSPPDCHPLTLSEFLLQRFCETFPPFPTLLSEFQIQSGREL